MPYEWNRTLLMVPGICCPFSLQRGHLRSTRRWPLLSRATSSRVGDEPHLPPRCGCEIALTVLPPLRHGRSISHRPPHAGGAPILHRGPRRWLCREVPITGPLSRLCAPILRRGPRRWLSPKRCQVFLQKKPCNRSLRQNSPPNSIQIRVRSGRPIQCRRP